MEPTNHRAVRRVRHEIQAREVTVVRTEPLGEGFVSITFHGDALASFVSLSFDDHVKFIIPGADGEKVKRDYTPLWYDQQARELTLEFALHGAGAASDWARSAVIGQPAIIAGPRGSMIIPDDLDWHLLAGDSSALPAIRRRLAELPPSARVIAVTAASGADRLLLQTQADVTWVDSDDALVEALRALPLPQGEGFAWFGGEASTAKQVREVLGQKGIGNDAMRVSAYWKVGIADHHEQKA